MTNRVKIIAAVCGIGVVLGIVVILVYMYMSREEFSVLTKKQKDMWVEASPFIGGQAIAIDPFDPTSIPLPSMPVPKDTFEPVGRPLKAMSTSQDKPSLIKSNDWFSNIPGFKVTNQGLVRDSFSDIPGFVVTSQGLKPESFSSIPGFKLTAQGLKPEQFSGIPGFKVTAGGLKAENWQPSYENQYDECDITGGCPNVQLFLDQAYNRTYVAAGKDESGHLFYEFYGPGRAFARDKYRRAFPDCPLPKSISY